MTTPPPPSNDLDRSARGYTAHLGSFQGTVEAALERVRAEGIIDRIWARDHTVWKEDPTEIGNRLGWLESPDVMKKAIPEITAFEADIHQTGFTQVLLLGMAGLHHGGTGQSGQGQNHVYSLP